MIVKRNSRCGFTLIEVMVALLIVGLAIPALMLQMGTMSDNLSRTRQTMLATWVAENRLQEIYLTKRLQNIIPRGRQAGDIDLANQKWDWVTETEALPGDEVRGIFRIDITVSIQGSEHPDAVISGFLYE